jgi:transglutaminase-like putative cysteine protease
MQIEINHVTTYQFSQPQARLIQLLRVTPLSFAGQNVLEWSIDVDCDARLRTSNDGFGNLVTMLYLDGPVSNLRLVKRGTVLTENRGGLIAGTIETLPPTAYLRSSALTYWDDAIAALARLISGRHDSQIDMLHALMNAIRAKMRFEIGEPTIDRTAETAFAEGHGVCQDFAHIFCAAARSLGIPARYVSGHLIIREGEAPQNASHAWVEAFVADLGWVAFDVTNGVCSDDGYVRVAIGLDYQGAAPLSGMRVGGGAEEMNVEVHVSQSGQQSQS